MNVLLIDYDAGLITAPGHEERNHENGDLIKSIIDTRLFLFNLLKSKNLSNHNNID